MKLNVWRYLSICVFIDDFVRKVVSWSGRFIRNGKLYQVTARRTFITLALQRGMTYKAVMKITGIRKIEALMLYDRVDDKELINQVSRVFGE